MNLHLGCGEIRLPGFVNVDVRPSSATDVVEDIAILPSFADNSIDVIYACHVLEHFGFGVVRPSVDAVIKRWVQLLKPGGKLLISVPDLRQIAKAWDSHPGSAQAHFDFIKATYGGCDYSENRHYIGFTEELLTGLLQQGGLTGIGRFNSFAKDTSQFILHGIPISLNIGGVKPRTDLSIVTNYVNTVDTGRLHDAQMGFLRGALRFNLTPIIVPSELGSRPKMGDLLIMARKHSCSGWMLWGNSDCELIADPRPFMRHTETCYGFHRREVPSGEICAGVDLYAIPCEIWDNHLSRDIPDLYAGATHIDWWVSRACQKIGKYADVREGVMVHPTHQRSGPSGMTNDPIYIHNVENYNAWAERNGVSKDFQTK